MTGTLLTAPRVGPTPGPRRQPMSPLHPLWFARHVGDSFASAACRLATQYDEALLHIELPEDDDPVGDENVSEVDLPSD